MFFWNFFWEINFTILLILFILFSFFLELKQSVQNSILLFFYLLIFLIIHLTHFNFDNYISDHASLIVFFYEFILVFAILYFQQTFFLRANQKMEFSTLVFFIFFLGILIFKSQNFLELFLVIESLSFVAYILAGFEKDTKIGSSVGIQYLIIGSISSIFLTMAFLLIYYQFGTAIFFDLLLSNLQFFNSGVIESNITQLSFDGILYDQELSNYSMLLIIMAFLIGTLFYKIKGAPFHVWAPTIYTRMPTSSLVILITFFTAIFSLYFFKLFFDIFYIYSELISQLFLLGGLLSLIFAFFGAFDQKLLKKFFIYSSIGHVAFLLFSFVFLGSLKSSLSLIMYLLIYLLSTFFLWYIITFQTEKIEFLSNLLKNVKNNTYFVFLFIIIIFSMSGIPPLAGFYIKFDILNLLAVSHEFFILFTTLLITVASFYYYLRLLKIANFENFSIFKFNFQKIEIFWTYIRLLFLSMFISLIFLFSVIFETSFYYLFQYFI